MARQIFDRYGFNSDGFKVVHDRLRVRNEQQFGEFICDWSLPVGLVV